MEPPPPLPLHVRYSYSLEFLYPILNPCCQLTKLLLRCSTSFSNVLQNCLRSLALKCFMCVLMTSVICKNAHTHTAYKHSVFIYSVYSLKIKYPKRLLCLMSYISFCADTFFPPFSSFTFCLKHYCGHKKSLSNSVAICTDVLKYPGAHNIHFNADILISDIMYSNECW